MCRDQRIEPGADSAERGDIVLGGVGEDLEDEFERERVEVGARVGGGSVGC